jgi:hypothetical protein
MFAQAVAGRSRSGSRRGRPRHHHGGHKLPDPSSVSCSRLLARHRVLVLEFTTVIEFTGNCRQTVVGTY